MGGGGGGAREVAYEPSLTLSSLRAVVVGNEDKFSAPAGEDNPFRLPLCLLCVGEHARAVRCLWRSGCQEEGLHLALALHFYRAIPLERSLEASGGGGGGSGGVLTGGGGSGGALKVPLADMLAQYTGRFMATDYHTAFEYVPALASDASHDQPRQAGLDKTPRSSSMCSDLRFKP